MKTALISVSDKTNLTKLVNILLSHNYKILSTGGTFQKLVTEFPNANIQDVSSYTNFPEFLDGRVKTLHPKIHGGILAKRNEAHLSQLQSLNIDTIDLIICNLYPFKETVKKEGISMEEVIENIDIGGHSLIRAGSKNFNDVLVITDIGDYDQIVEHLYQNNNLDNINRQEYARKAFQHIMEYDVMISNYFNQLANNNDTITRVYKKAHNLKYGTNPQQKMAGIYYNNVQNDIPYKILNGNPGYINILDAIYAWNLVYELRKTLNLPAAASFKHTSPAGAAVYVPFDEKMRKVYNIAEDKHLTPVANAFIRARNADPMCSYGDFIAISDKVDEETAKVISIEVSDGIIAPEYSEEALEILKKKKNGAYVILQADNIGYECYINMNKIEVKELHGVTLIQEENNKLTTNESLTNVVTNNNNLTDNIRRDMIVANTTLKYTQSNSVAYVKDGQCIGIGAGQQSRIDCVKLAKRKAETWYLRQHPKCIELFDKFEKGVKRQVKTNAIVQYIEGDFTEIEYCKWIELFKTDNDIKWLSDLERKEFIKTLKDVTLGSDAFFPFRDNIDTAAKIGVKNIVQPGGSIADNEVIAAANEYKMCMVFTGSEMRMFLH